MRSVNSYQDIKGPEEIEEERMAEHIFSDLMEEFDPECGDYNAYRAWCRRESRIRASEYMQEEEED